LIFLRFFKMQEENEMEKKSLEKELSYLIELTLFLEDELNNVVQE